ncbi:hypothetical protein N752_01460 [Desulforamulus aquiferis]|nr:hypothetical protein N752_01460 [Desulforamulus aquiferis]
MTLLSGCSEIGQGSDTVLCQIAAEELGIPFEWVRIISGDSGVTPDGGPSTASRQTYVSGNAVKKAAEDAKSHMIQLASEILKCTIEELMVANQRITSIKDEHKTIAFARWPRKLTKGGNPLSATAGMITPPVTLTRKPTRGMPIPPIFMLPRLLMWRWILRRVR